MGRWVGGNCKGMGIVSGMMRDGIGSGVGIVNMGRRGGGRDSFGSVLAKVDMTGICGRDYWVLLKRVEPCISLWPTKHRLNSVYPCRARIY